MTRRVLHTKPWHKTKRYVYNLFITGHKEQVFEAVTSIAKWHMPCTRDGSLSTGFSCHDALNFIMAILLLVEETIRGKHMT